MAGFGFPATTAVLKTLQPLTPVGTSSAEEERPDVPAGLARRLHERRRDVEKASGVLTPLPRMKL
nr:hypothetical protein [Streptomyces bicolor]